MSVESGNAPVERLELLGRLLGRHLESQTSVDLLTAWGRQPGGWCSRRAVGQFTSASRCEIDEALAELVQDGVLQQQSGALYLFALAEDTHVRWAVMELARLAPSERRYLARGAIRDQESNAAARAATHAGPASTLGREGADPR